MANRSYLYEITWCYKEDGNRPDNIEDITEVSSTTVQRAIGKLVRELNAPEGAEPLTKDDEEFLRASDLMIIDVRTHKLNDAIIKFKKENGRTGV
jgi:hypothetical protein